MGAALVATSLVAVSQAAVAKAAKPACTVQQDDGNWPGYAQGKPAGINPKTAHAVYMWHDGDGWHVRATHRTTNLKSFSGQITTGGTFANVKPVRFEKNDKFVVSPDKHVITFLFKNYGYIDGLNFRTRCAPSITFGFQSDGKTTPAHKIVVGRRNVHPSTNPFTVFRVKPPVTTTTVTSPPSV